MVTTIKQVEAVLLSVPRNADFSPAEVLILQIHSSEGQRGVALVTRDVDADSRLAGQWQGDQGVRPT